MSSEFETAEFFTLAATWGIPYLITTVAVVFFVHTKLNWRIDRIPAFLARQGTYDDDKKFAKAAKSTSLGIALCLLIPTAILIFWGTDAAEQVTPITAGIAVAAVGCSITLGVFGMAAWKATKYRMTAAVWLPLLASALAYMGFMATVVFLDTPFSFFAFSCVFLSLNMVPMILITYLNAPGRIIDFKIFAKAAQAPADSSDTSQSSTAGAGSPISPATTDPAEVLPSMLTDGAKPFAGELTAKDKTRLTRMLYALALALLITYAVLTFTLVSDNTAKSASIGTAAAVLVLDVTMFLYKQAGLLKNPALLCLVMILGRALMTISSNLFFVGQSGVYLIFAIMLGVQIVNVRVPRKDKAAARKAALGDPLKTLSPGTRASAGTPKSTASGGSSKVTPAELEAGTATPKTKPSMADRFKRHEFILGFITVCFVIELIAVALQDDLPTLQLSESGVNHHQYVFGIAALIMGSIVPLLVLVLRYYGNHNRELSKPVLIAFGGFMVFVLAAGLYMYWLTSSNLIFWMSIFYPPLFIISVLGYQLWASNDYDFLRPVTERTPTGSSLFEAIKTGGLPKHDKTILGFTMASVFLFIALGATTSTAVAGEAWIGWSLSAWTFILMSTVFSVLKYFNTLEMDIGLGVAAGSSTLVLLLWGWGMYSGPQNSTLDAGTGAVLAAVLGYPTLVGLGTGLYKWKDDDWKMTLYTKLSLGISLGAIVIGSILLVVFVQPIFLGLSVLAAVVLLITVIGMGAYWVGHKFKLPEKAKYVLGGLVASVMILGVVAGLTGGGVFLGFSVAWGALWVGVAMMVARAWAKHSHEPHVTSHTLFPVYRFDAAKGDIASASKSVQWVFLLLSVTVFWAVGAVVFLSPAYIGIGIGSLTSLLGLILAVDLIRRPMVKFGEAVPFVTPEDIAEAIQTASESQMGSLSASTVSSKKDIDISDRGSASHESTDTPTADATVSGPPARPTDTGKASKEEDEANRLIVAHYSSGKSADDIHKMLRSLMDSIKKGKPVGLSGESLGLRQAWRLVPFVDEALNVAHHDEVRFGLHLQLLVLASAQERKTSEERKLVDFLRSIGQPNVTVEEIQSWSPEKRADFEAKRQEYIAKKKAEERKQEELAEEELEAQRRRAAAQAEEARKRAEALAEEEARLAEEEARRQAELEALADEAEKEAEKKKLEEEMKKRRRQARDGPLVEDIVHEYKSSGTKWVDPKFPPQLTSLSRKAAGESSGDGAWRGIHRWARPEELVRGKKPALFLSDSGTTKGATVTPEDIRQGALGDCWFLSAIAVAALKPERIKALFPNPEAGAEAGVYTVRFFQNGEWKEILVDDQIPVTGNGRPGFAHSEQPNELWVMLLEKAYAKLHGGFENIEGGLVHVGLVDLTGGASESVKLDDAAARRAISDGSLWAKIKSYHESGYLMGCGSHAGSDTDISDMGIVQGHAYSILSVVTVDGHKLIQCRNPWGRVEWNGDWSDDSGRWSKRMKAKVDYKKADDGSFWIAFEDFVNHFRNLYVCRLFSDSWHETTVKAEWKGPTAGGCPNFASAKDNPQFLITVQRDTKAFIVLRQKDRRALGEDDLHIAFFLLRKSGKRAARFGKRELIASSGTYVNRREVSAEVDIDPSDGGLTLFCSTFEAGQESEFSVTIHSDKPLRISELGKDVPVG